MNSQLSSDRRERMTWDEWALWFLVLGGIAAMACACWGCAVVPPMVTPANRTVDSRGNPTSGVWGEFVYQGAKGIIVDPLLVVPTYAELQPVYGKQVAPPAPPVKDAFVTLPNGTWCSAVVFKNYEDMGILFDQDKKP
jgi:hypothetical protein